MAPKGSGSENMSFLRMLNPSDGRKGVKKFVLECVFESGANPCPPMIVGIGLGGTSATSPCSLAKEASCFRKIGTRTPDPQVAALESELLDLINQTGIGPQGSAARPPRMAVNIEWAHTHISQLPVAVNMQCWRGERAVARTIAADGNGDVRELNGDIITPNPAHRSRHPQAASLKTPSTSTATSSAFATRRRFGSLTKASRRPRI